MVIWSEIHRIFMEILSIKKKGKQNSLLDNISKFHFVPFKKVLKAFV